MITCDDVRRHAMRRVTRRLAIVPVDCAAQVEFTWPHAERRRWACALNDYGWRCAPPVGQFWFDQAVHARSLRGVRMCIVDTARPGTRHLGEDSIT